MKEVQDRNGDIIKVPNDTPCRPGSDGALPIVLDPVLDAKVFTELEQRQKEYQRDINKRRKAEKKALIKAAMAEADEMIPEVLAGEIDKQVWLDKRAEIKQRFPKED